MSGPLLDVRHFSLSFGGGEGRVRAVRDATFALEAGRVTGIVGESGSGKTTVASAILRLLAPGATVEGGEIRFDGRDLLTLPAAELRALRGRDIAMVFQDPMTSLNPLLTVGTQLCHVQHRDRLSRRRKRERAAAMLARVGIADAAERLDAYPHSFSGGMRQRVAIAMALLGRPRLLIADEPTTALDATTEAQILALLRELQRETGSAILFISHSLGVIAQLCDRVVVMYAGSVVEQGDVDAIFDRPRHPYTQALLASDPAFLPEATALLPTIGGEVPNLARLPRGCVFSPRCAQAVELCRQAEPAERPLPGGGTVRCHRVEVAA